MHATLPARPPALSATVDRNGPVRHEPVVPKLRGVPLIVTWVVLAGAPWVVAWQIIKHLS
ncbi:hypothetical protein [Azospirillum halopraeferens]|uniref:hypothetical protein n=1 Tax=Azospirillum halopraeferens TaxID=34010 RepID=UPI0012EB4D3D|nr:hypothetical protein [Azospirillum halopraeferens]